MTCHILTNLSRKCRRRWGATKRLSNKAQTLEAVRPFLSHYTFAALNTVTSSALWRHVCKAWSRGRLWRIVKAASDRKWRVRWWWRHRAHRKLQTSRLDRLPVTRATHAQETWPKLEQKLLRHHNVRTCWKGNLVREVRETPHETNLRAAVTTECKAVMKVKSVCLAVITSQQLLRASTRELLLTTQKSFQVILRNVKC